MSLIYKAKNYLKKNGIKQFIKRSIEELFGNSYTSQNIVAINQNITSLNNSNQESKNIKKIGKQRFPNLKPLQVFMIPKQKPRINLITDSINSGSLYGGVATAIIFATLLAKQYNSNLRIITRTEKAIPHNIKKILTSNKIDFNHEVEFFFADIFSDSYQMDISESDIYITTSWWTTDSTIKTISPQKIIYLLQEDERMFYPYSDDHYQSTKVMGNSSIKFVINTKLLFDHLIKSGFDNIKNQGLYFEPSFVPHYFKEKKSSKKKFFFYARPNNLRNLFYLGLEVIDMAITQDILPLEEWDIYFVGKDLEILHNLSFDNYKPKFKENLTFPEYIDFISSIDLGLSLMYTPHPSYPPLDLAASGAVVITNTFEGKSNLKAYSDNIICKHLSVEDLVTGIEEGVKIVNQNDIRQKNFTNNSLCKDWNKSFQYVLNNLVIMD